MRNKLHFIIATFVLLTFQLQIANATDPIRGLYVDRLLRWSGGYPTIDEQRTLLGRTAEEDSLLKFARDNNFKYLILYDMEKIFAHPTAILPNSGGRTYKQALCDFMVKAQTQFCIQDIGAIISSNSYLDSILSYNNLLITDPYDFGNSQFIPDNPNPLDYVENTYTSADGAIALRSEIMKTMLRINDFNSFCNSKFDVITTEYEFWQRNQSAGCTILDSIYLKHADTLDYHGTIITTPSSITLDNTITLTLPISSIVWDGATRTPPVYLKFCKTNAQFWEYRQLLVDMQTAQAGATHPILLDTYIGWLNQDTISDLLQTNILDSMLNQVGIHTYNTHPSWLWNYFNNDRDYLFAHNNIAGTITHPIFSAEMGFSGDSMSIGMTWFEIEKAFRFDYAQNYNSHHNNDSLLPGTCIWFDQTEYKTSQFDTTYKKNKLFIRPSATCSGSNVFFDYVGPYEGGISFVWNYADGTIDSAYNLAVSAQDKNHTFNNAGNYIVSCTLYYPAPTDTGIGGCTPYTYRDTVTITGAAITGSPLAFCDGGSVTLTATFTSTGTYTWKKNGVNITGATNQTYVATTSGTYSVVVTNLTGCATSTAAVVVTVYPKPDISITSTTNVSCPSLCDGAANTSVASGTSPFTYSWTGGATTANISSVCINTYTVIVTDANGCKDTTNTTVSNPANSCDLTTDYCAAVATTSIGSTFPSASVALHNNLTVDNNFFIRGTEVKIDSGIVITISSGKTLTISDTSWLHACRKMWQGIKLTDSTSTLVIDSASTVEDADTAAKAHNGGTVRIINGDTLRRNLVSVSMKTGTSNLTVSGATFDCPTVLNVTTAGNYSSTHILLSDADTISIGDSTNQNVFINATKGIDATRTYLTVFNAQIYNDTSIINNPDSASFGIKFIGDTATANAYSLAVDNNVVPVTIKNYGYGIFSKLRTLNQIWYNEIHNCNYGVYLDHVRDNRSDIRRNNFLTCRTNAIYLYDISISMGWVHVNDNTINIGSSLAADETSTGIRAENLMPFHTHVTIVYNQINNVRYGVHVTNFHDADASSNQIYYPQSFTGHSADEYIGMLFENSTGIYISRNTIAADSTPVAGMDTVLRGISLDLSTDNVLRENILTKMGAGARVNMDCKPSLFYCNIFDTCRTSIYYENAGSIGEQGTVSVPYDNIFQANINTNKIDGDGSANIGSNWYVRGDETDPANTYSVLPSNSSLVTSFDSIDVDVYICDDIEEGGGEGEGRAQSLAGMTEGSSGGGEYENESQYMNKSTAYRILDENDSLMYLDLPTDTILQNFYDEYSSSNIAMFQEVKTLAEQGETEDAISQNENINDTNLIEYNTRIVNEIYFEATQSDTLHLTSAQVSALQNIAYQNPMEGGEAVYRARAMLRIYISSNSSSVAYRKAKQDYKPRIISADNFRIYPVPATDYFMIRNNDRQEKKIQFVIFDNTGRTMRKSETKISEEIFISTSSLMQGIYSLQIISSDKAEMHRLIIVH